MSQSLVSSMTLESSATSPLHYVHSSHTPRTETDKAAAPDYGFSARKTRNVDAISRIRQRIEQRKSPGSQPQSPMSQSGSLTQDANMLEAEELLSKFKANCSAFRDELDVHPLQQAASARGDTLNLLPKQQADTLKQDADVLEAEELLSQFRASCSAFRDELDSKRATHPSASSSHPITNPRYSRNELLNVCHNESIRNSAVPVAVPYHRNRDWLNRNSAAASGPSQLENARSERARFRIQGWTRQVYAIKDDHYLSICTVVDPGGNAATLYRPTYDCGVNGSKSPPRPAHQLALRSVDAKNREGLGAPAFELRPNKDEAQLEFSQSAELDLGMWRHAQEGVVFCSLFWHNPQSYTGGDVSIAAAGGGKGCLYDLIKVNQDEFELQLVFDGDQNAASVDRMITKNTGWWRRCDR